MFFDLLGGSDDEAAAPPPVQELALALVPVPPAVVAVPAAPRASARSSNPWERKVACGLVPGNGGKRGALNRIGFGFGFLQVTSLR